MSKYNLPYNPYTKDPVHLHNNPHISRFNECYNMNNDQCCFNQHNSSTPIYPYSKIQVHEFPGRLRSDPYYQRAASTDNIHKEMYGPSGNNFIHHIHGEQYNPYSRFGPRRYDDKKMKINEKRHYDQYNKSCFYYNNSNSSLRKSLYSNFTYDKQDQFSYNHLDNDKGDEEQQCLGYRDVPIYKQKAVNLNITPIPISPSKCCNRSNSVNNHMYYHHNSHNRYDINNNIHNRLISNYRGVANQFYRRSGVSSKNYYDNYTRDMKSDYKDNFIWYGKSRLGDKMYRYYYNEPIYRKNENEYIKKPPVDYYHLK